MSAAAAATAAAWTAVSGGEGISGLLIITLFMIACWVVKGRPRPRCRSRSRRPRHRNTHSSTTKSSRHTSCCTVGLWPLLVYLGESGTCVEAVSLTDGEFKEATWGTSRHVARQLGG